MILKIIEREDMVEQLKKIKEYFLNKTTTNQELRLRILSSIVLLPAVLFFLTIKSLFIILILIITILMSFEWITIVNTKTKDLNFWRILGVIYILLPNLSFIYLRNLKNGFDIVLWLILIVCGTDVSAMFVGKIFQGPKLTSISPSKTWSGLFGGIITSMIIGLFTSFFFKSSFIFFIIFSGFMAVLEQASDILESKFKRIFEVKDSGDIIPGHGGIMDRLDGFTLTAPFVLFVAIFFNIF